MCCTPLILAHERQRQKTSVSSRPVWSKLRVPEQPGLHFLLFEILTPLFPPPLAPTPHTQGPPPPMDSSHLSIEHLVSPGDPRSGHQLRTGVGEKRNKPSIKIKSSITFFSYYVVQDSVPPTLLSQPTPLTGMCHHAGWANLTF